MAETESESISLSHELSWDLRLVILGIGLVALAYPFLVARMDSQTAEHLSGLAKVAWMGGGALAVAFAALGVSTNLTAHEGQLVLRKKGLFGRSRQVFPAEAVSLVEVGNLMVGNNNSYHVAVKLKGIRRSFMGTDYKNREDAEAERQAFLKALGRAE